jgi:L-asparaginase II
MPQPPASFPDDPVVVRVLRGGEIESVHRGAWCLAAPSGAVLASAGAVEHPFTVRSSVKPLQALPLFESGAAERLELREAEVALAIASHSGEACHVEVVRGLLARLGLDERHLRCGAHPPTDARAREELRARGEAPSALHNNCSGKHAAFLAQARHLGVPHETYLDPEGRVQALARAAIAEVAGVAPGALVPALDGCSAPTYRLPLRALATAFARLANPAGLAPERRAAAERMTRAAAAHPVLVGGSRKRLDTDLLAASLGRLFPKIGAEAIHATGLVGGGCGLAVKIDDGGERALPVLVVALLERLGLARAPELAALGPWREQTLRNHAGLEASRIEVVGA